MIRQLRNAVEDFRAALRSDGATAVAEPASGSAVGEASPAAAAPPVVGPPGAPAERATPAVPEAEGRGAVQALPPATSADASRQRRVLAVPRWLWATATLGLALALVRWAPWTQAEPADPEVVAIYQGGTVTRARLQQQLDTVPEAERALYRSPGGLRALVGDVVVHEVTRRWAEERQVDQRESFTDAMKHATEEIQIADVSDQLHQGRIQVGEAEIQAYYEQNRARFGERPLVEVKDAIRQAVVEEKEGAFVEQYLQDLRERASLEVDDNLLDVPEPTEQELVAAYQGDRERYRVPEQVKIAQIRLDMSHDGGHERTQAQAEAIRARAAAGEDFGQLAQDVSDGPEKAQDGVVEQPVARGSRGQAFDDAVFPLRVGDISPVFMEGDSHYIVKLLERLPERVRPYEEVRGEVEATLRAEREQQVYAERSNRTLFTIHGRRTTLGEFLQELQELPEEQRARYAGPDGKRKLLDAFIERLLVVEDAAEQATDVKRKDDIAHARSDLLAQLLHQEQVDEQVQVSDEEVRAEYDRNRAHYADPPQVKVRYIRVSRGRTADEEQQARAKIQEAEQKARGKSGPLGLGGGEPPLDFGEVAKQYSEDPETAANGGLLDRWLGESQDPVSEVFEHALHEQLLPLQVNDISPILPLGDSYYLFQVTEKQEARQRSFEEARDTVRRELEARKHEELTQNMQRQLLDRMQLRVYDNRLQQLAAELAPATPAAR